MSEHTAQLVVVRLPAELVDDTLLADLPSARRLLSVRGSALDTVATVLCDGATIGSGAVTIALARTEIAAFARRIVDRVRGRAATGDSSAGVVVTVEIGGRRVELRADDPEAVRQLVRVIGDIDLPDAGSPAQTDTTA